MSPRWGSTPRLTDWLTISRKVTLTLTWLWRDEREPSAWGHDWATLFLGDVNTGTWSSRLGESQIWDSKIWSRVPRDSNQRIIALARTSSNCKQQTRSLVKESDPHQQTRNCLTVIKAPDGSLTPKQTGRLPVGCNVTLTVIWLQESFETVVRRTEVTGQ
jgi:hypothetical protein